MAVAYITEYESMAVVATGLAPIAQDPPIAEQVVAISTHTESAAFNAATRFIRVHVDAICSISVGLTPVATTVMRRMAANQTEYFGVVPGKGWKISVVSNS
jgi:hypothetical protein